MEGACVLVLDETARDARTGRLARLMTLGWAVERGVSPDVAMEALGIPSLGAFHSAVHRAKARMRADRSLAAAVEQAADLTQATARSRLGSDPWRDQRAARAAS
jgi:hypothetical protein